MGLNRMMRASQPDHSPCVGHCTTDSEGLCLSCRRHKDEVAVWKDGAEADRLKVWARLPAAIDGVGRNLMRLPLAPEDIAVIADEMLDSGGAWAAGFGGHWFHGIRKEGGEGMRNAAATENGETVVLNIAGPGAPGKVRALAWARNGRKLAEGVGDLPIVLVVPTARLDFPVHASPSRLGDGRKDLGLGLPSVRLVEEAGGRVLETMLARVEGLKDGYGDSSPDSATPPGLDLNENYVLGAILLPKGARI